MGRDKLSSRGSILGSEEPKGLVEDLVIQSFGGESHDDGIKRRCLGREVLERRRR